jgi:hypothetical protein
MWSALFVFFGFLVMIWRKRRLGIGSFYFTLESKHHRLNTISFYQAALGIKTTLPHLAHSQLPFRISLLRKAKYLLVEKGWHWVLHPRGLET